jgi:glycosyltransferase involved in cell wall biosynthesis
MNVLYVSHYFLPFSIGGVEDHTLNLARDMTARGHSVHVFHGVIERGTDDYHVFSHVHEGISCTAVSVDLKTIDDFSGTWRQAEVERIFAQLLDAQKFDLVHIMHLTRLSTGLVDVLRKRGIPTVLTLHDYWMQCARGQRVRLDGETCHEIVETRCAPCMAQDVDYFDRLKPWWKKLLDPGSLGKNSDRSARHLSKIRERRKDMLHALESVDLVLTASRYTREAFKGWGVEREIVVVNQGVDPALAAQFRETSSPVLRFGFAGRMMETKGVEVLIDAFRGLDVEAELLIHGVGEAKYVKSLEARASGSKIQFRGPYQRAQIPEVYATFDVQVVPSTWLECQPLVMQTARLFRKPLIASSIGGMIELVRDGVDGFLFRVGDAGDLREKMKRLASDSGLVRRMVEATPVIRSAEDYTAAIEAHYQGLTTAR